MYIRILAIHCITVFLKIRNIISKNRRSKVDHFSALRVKVISKTYFYPKPDNIFLSRKHDVTSLAIKCNSNALANATRRLIG